MPAVTAPATAAPARHETARTSPASPRAPVQVSKPSALSDARVREIYAKYVESRRSLNESTAGITVESLAKSLRGSSDKLRTQHNAKSVDFEVQVKNGRTVLKPIVK
jgi:hypothetical protein